MTSIPYTARAALRAVKELVEARRIVSELGLAAHENSVRIANVDEDRIVSPDAVQDALGAAWALERSLDKLRDVITDALAVYMFGRDEDRDDLVIRLEEEVREAGDAELVAYENKVIRAIQVEGYIDRPRYLLDRYPETMFFCMKSGIGPGDCARQILDNYEGGVLDQGLAATPASPQQFFIALPATLTPDEIEGIWGIGRTAALAVDAAYQATRTRPAIVAQDEEGTWIVSYDGVFEECSSEADARAYVNSFGFRAEPCTEELYYRIKEEGYDVTGSNSYGYAWRGDFYDVVERNAV